MGDVDNEKYRLGYTINMPYEFSKKKIKIFCLALILLTLSLLCTYFIDRALEKDYATMLLSKIRLEIDYLRFSSQYNQQNGASLLGSIFGATGSEAAMKIDSAPETHAHSVPVLLYHAIVEDPSGNIVTVQDFESHMIALKKGGWNTISMSDFQKFMNGEIEVPDKSFVLTFDDGPKTSYYPVDPILRTLGFNAVNFIITGRSLSRKNLKVPYALESWELKDMLRSGRWELESHGRDDHELYAMNEKGDLDHFLSNKLWLKEANRLETDQEFETRISSDLGNSKKDLEEKFDIKVNSFAFPFSDFGEITNNFPGNKSIILNATKKEYDFAFYQTWPGIGDYFNYPTKDAFKMIKRIEVMHDVSTEKLLTMLETEKSKSLPYKDTFDENNGWQKTWGSMDIRDGSLILTANEGRSGSSVFLQGGYLWDSYQINANITPLKGYSFSILGHYQDDKNYVACIYTPEFIRIEEVTDGRINRIGQWLGNPLEQSREFGIQMSKRSLQCLVDRKAIVSGVISVPTLNHGGVGLRTWDLTPNNSKIQINTISIE
jgi:peptidoglycan/xylan/chitin deacetylase (PgdA/CDA1 family)